MDINLPLIDISIVTYNSSKWLDSFIKSLCQQHYPLQKINLIFRDNQSSDNTLSILEKIQADHSDKFASVQIFTDLNKGFGYGHNSNIKNSNSEYILVTNVDLELEAQSLLTVVKTAVKDNKNVASWELRQKPYEHPKIYNPVTLETNWSSSACILFRRSAFEAVKGYEERIFLYGEDVEISYRLRDNGYILKYCPKAVCWHYSYKYAHELKPAQFFGSTLANIYIRLRYGNMCAILIGFAMYLALFFYPIKIRSKNKGLLKNLINIVKDAPYFLFTRKKSRERFPINVWNYDKIREGAFVGAQQGISDDLLPTVTIIIRTYQNRQNWLKQAVASVINQTYLKIELIIVEDGSELNKEFVQQLSQKQLLYRVIYAPIPKSGRCRAGNHGLTLATGQYIGFLDDDDLFFADHIETLVTALNKKTEYAAAYGNAFQVVTQVKSLAPLIYQEKSYNIIYKKPFSRALLWDGNYIPIQTVLFRRELYATYGGLDESLENLEDWNLWTRYSLNHEFIYIPKTTSLYRVPAHCNDIVERQKKLESYYEMAIAKQKEMYLTHLSLFDLRSYASELKASAFRKLFYRKWLKGILVNSKLLNRFYYPLLKIKQKINL